MKKAVSLILVLVLCLGLCACGSNSESKFIGEYEFKGTVFEEHWRSGNTYRGDYLSCTEVLTLKSGGTGTFKTTTTEAGDYYKVGDVVSEGKVNWSAEGNYITITFSGFSYDKSYGKNKTDTINRTSTYERKAGTLHSVSSGYLAYTKIS